MKQGKATVALVSHYAMFVAHIYRLRADKVKMITPREVQTWSSAQGFDSTRASEITKAACDAGILRAVGNTTARHFIIVDPDLADARRFTWPEYTETVTEVTDATLAEVDGLVDEVKHLLVGRHPQVMGLVIIQMAAMYYAGHHPSIRDHVRELQLDTISDLIPIYERELFLHTARPADWPITPLREPKVNRGAP